MAAPAQKLCTNCGIDVSKKPRTKDAMGRYFCEPCDAKLQAAKAAPPAGPSRTPAAPPATFDLEPMEGALISEAAASPVKAVAISTGVCDACAAPMPAGAKVCFNCGFNTETGKLLKTKVIKERAPKLKRPKKMIHVGAGGAFLIATVLQAIPFTLWVMNPDEAAFGMIFMVIAALLNIVTGVMILFTPFQAGEYGWGIVILIAHFVPILGQILILYYLFGVTERGSVKGLFLACILGVAAFAVMFIQRSEELKERRESGSHSLGGTALPSDASWSQDHNGDNSASKARRPQWANQFGPSPFFRAVPAQIPCGTPGAPASCSPRRGS